ncbi:MAG TPA: cobalt-precorrin-5B (C(1))-methyltransferase CbiD [Victivallales bacterium]|nr:cobalt-precorrin-5B (C(1))-methyltransferase CbiD [Victivallales bacterium]
MKSKYKKLRKGYTTGACAASGALAAYIALKEKIYCSSVIINFLNGEQHSLPVEIIECNKKTAVSKIIKDAGDDPDVTDKAVILVKVSCIENNNYFLSEDHIEVCGNGKLSIRGGEGVGLVSKPGLEVECGKWAINSGPRKMIVDNLQKAGFGKIEHETLLVEIIVLDGERLAKKTLNPRLGVKGGISILGTTGIVEPYSNSAYIRTVEIMIKSIVKLGVHEIAFTTGSRSLKAIQRDCPKLPEYTCIRIGDFIFDSIKAAKREGIEIINIGCMPGKLFKYACGIENTHAHKARLDISRMKHQFTECGISGKLLEKVIKCRTLKEISYYIPNDEYIELLKMFFNLAYLNLKKWADSIRLNLYLYSIDGKLILSKIEQ